jgi:ABC-type nitrate/sulfonate/bicarbonate transport system substrate-binding protein
VPDSPTAPKNSKEAPQGESLKVSATKRQTCNIGFVPMIDCAPLIVAQELGLFAKHGTSVRLTRELGWATIREKLLHQELDAAHAPASMAFAIHCGIGVVPRPCVAGMVMSLNGSAITLSHELRKLGVRNAVTLKQLIDRERDRRTFHFGAVLDLSTQNYNLRTWLKAGGIDPDVDVQITVVPPPLVHRALADRHLDGYCVAEPWNSLAVHEGTGWIVETASNVAPRHPEKVFLVLEKFAKDRSKEFRALLAALIEASIFCEQPANRKELIRILAQPCYLDVPARILENSLLGPLSTGYEERDASNFIIFHRDNASAPTRSQGWKVFNQIREAGRARACRRFRPDVISRIFREDLYQEACQEVGPREEPNSGSRLHRESAPPPSPNGMKASTENRPLRWALAG